MDKKGRRRHLIPEQIEEIGMLHDKGLSYDAISDELSARWDRPAPSPATIGRVLGKRKGAQSETTRSKEGPRRHLTPGQIEEIGMLRDKGLSYDAISHELSERWDRPALGKQTIRRALGKRKRVQSGTAVLVEEYLNLLTYQGKAKSTRASYGHCLQRLIEKCPEYPTDRRQVLRVLGDPALSYSYRRYMDGILRGFFRWARITHQLADPLKSLLKLPSREEPQRVLSDLERDSLLDACKTPQEQALCLLAVTQLPWEQSLTLEEIVQLGSRDVGRGYIRVGRLPGRVIKVAPEVSDALLELGERERLFLGPRRPLSVRSLQKLYSRLFRQAGISSSDGNYRTLRRTSRVVTREQIREDLGLLSRSRQHLTNSESIGVG